MHFVLDDIAFEREIGQYWGWGAFQKIMNRPIERILTWVKQSEDKILQQAEKKSRS